MIDMVQSAKNGGCHDIAALRVAHWVLLLRMGRIDRSSDVGASD
jgi:hypothetical protein